MAGKKPHTVLVADDDPEILALIARRLAKKGYTVLEAQDGPEALEVARAKLPDAIVLDVMMPGKNGWEVCRELRSDPGTKGIGILILTAIGEKMNEMNSPLFGADAYLDKPFEFADLDRLVNDVLAKTKK
jgi:DNA-binding response OmpR family regulator